ncbi:site-specific tyrosine recombinase XerD [Aquimarina agarivorans]|uniref:site-specific tyrosine recombinase XerD n=1 Tax=Aquimarina agarivorans TaxID=980584 RepID=UPI000248EC2A|nr:site-specific tyrosine recombinase XerD [Aquimarina agarivorans]
MNWKNSLNDYTNYLSIERGLSDNSITNYSLDIIKLINYLESNEINASPITISKTDIQQFIYEIAKILHERSQARIISGLRGFFDYLIFENYRVDNPMDLIESPKIGQKLPDTLSLEEIDTIISQVDYSKAEGERNHAIIEMLYGCGLRVSELTNLKISDLYFEEGFIAVTGKGNKQRLIPIAEHTQKTLQNYLDNSRTKVTIKKDYTNIIFLNRRGSILTRAMIFTIVKNLVKRARIEKNISPHTFRHSFATHLLENGANLRAIQQMLGHESITTTEIYMHLDRQHLSDTLNKFHPRKNM